MKERESYSKSTESVIAKYHNGSKGYHSCSAEGHAFGFVRVGSVLGFVLPKCCAVAYTVHVHTYIVINIGIVVIIRTATKVLSEGVSERHPQGWGLWSHA